MPKFPKFPLDVPDGKVRFGVSFTDKNLVDDKWETPIGKPLPMYRRFFSWAQATNGTMKNEIEANYNLGRATWASFKTPTTTTSWADVANGDYDTQLDSIFNSLYANTNIAVWLTPYHEPENNASPEAPSNGDDLSGTLAEWKAMVRHVESRRKRINAHNILIVPIYMDWTFDAASGRDIDEWLLLDSDFPVIGVDPYTNSFGTSPSRITGTTFNTMITKLEASNKRIAIGECGGAIGTNNVRPPELWEGFVQECLDHDIIACCWFDIGDNETNASPGDPDGDLYDAILSSLDSSVAYRDGLWWSDLNTATATLAVEYVKPIRYGFDANLTIDREANTFTLYIEWLTAISTTNYWIQFDHNYYSNPYPGPTAFFDGPVTYVYTGTAPDPTISGFSPNIAFYYPSGVSAGSTLTITWDNPAEPIYPFAWVRVFQNLGYTEFRGYPDIISAYTLLDGVSDRLTLTGTEQPQGAYINKYGIEIDASVIEVELDPVDRTGEHVIISGTLTFPNGLDTFMYVSLGSVNDEFTMEQAYTCQTSVPVSIEIYTPPDYIIITPIASAPAFNDTFSFGNIAYFGSASTIPADASYSFSIEFVSETLCDLLFLLISPVVSGESAWTGALGPDFYLYNNNYIGWVLTEGAPPPPPCVEGPYPEGVGIIEPDNTTFALGTNSAPGSGALGNISAAWTTGWLENGSLNDSTGGRYAAVPLSFPVNAAEIELTASVRISRSGVNLGNQFTTQDYAVFTSLSKSDPFNTFDVLQLMDGDEAGPKTLSFTRTLSGDDLDITDWQILIGLPTGQIENVGQRSWAVDQLSVTIDVSCSSEPPPPPPPPPAPEPTALVWDGLGDREYQNGLDRGVLYLPDGRVVPWNGLVSVQENPNVSVQPVRYDGAKISQVVTMGNYNASLTAITYPDELNDLQGLPQMTPGFSVTEQPPKPFGLSYRTRILNDLTGEPVGYKIHIVYNVVATPSSVGYETLSDTASATEFQWDLTALPAFIDGYRPAAKLIIGTLNINPLLLVQIERILYGTPTIKPSLPAMRDLIAYIKTWFSFQIIDNGDGTWTATTEDPNYIYLDTPGIDQFTLANVNATYLDGETYTISDT
jgi:hypothetical protein